MDYMKKKTKAETLLELMENVATNYNIDVTTTHNETDAEYNAIRLNAMQDAARAIGMDTNVTCDESGKITSISVDKKTKTFPD